LEKIYYSLFDDKPVNKVNARKEFFRLPITEIKEAVHNFGLDEVHWTLKTEAAEYRESLSLKKTLEVHEGEGLVSVLS
jgi:hypothetical protein